MVETIERYGTERGLKMLGDWTDRIAKGELPASKPPRPQGLERNVVITVWDWAGPKAYLHDEIATDKRNPTINAYGSLYGATENSTDNVPILDPVTNTATTVKIPVRDPKTPSALSTEMFAPSAYWGDEKIWTAQTIPHSLMLDEKARVWYAARIRSANNPDYCKKGSDHPSAKLFPIDKNSREIAMLDPPTQKFTLIDTCFPTHHVQFGFDKDRTLWTSSGGIGAEVLGWINTKVLEETGDEAKAQGWTAFVLDTNGNGKRDEGYVEPNQPVDPTKDKRIRVGFYSIAPNPADGTIWGTVTGYPGSVVRVDPGASPPATALSEIYEVPLPGYSPRGGDIDSKGVMWSALASGHLGALRPQQVQGPAERPARDRQALPRGLDALSAAGTAARRRRGQRQRRDAVLRLGRPAQHLRAGQRRSVRHRQPERLADRAGRRQAGQPGRALSDGLLGQGARRAHRRSQCRLERPRRLVEHRQPHALPSRGRQGHDAEDRALPDAARSAGAVSARAPRLGKSRGLTSSNGNAARARPGCKRFGGGRSAALAASSRPWRVSARRTRICGRVVRAQTSRAYARLDGHAAPREDTAYGSLLSQGRPGKLPDLLLNRKPAFVLRSLGTNRGRPIRRRSRVNKQCMPRRAELFFAPASLSVIG